MMNGEGTSETLPESVSLNNKLNDELLSWKASDQKLSNPSNEVSPISSRYSSCGESDVDRYCSANSVMGTPSLCSSVGTFQDFTDSDFGSVRSPRVGDVGGLENFNLNGKFGRRFDNRSSLSLGRLGEYKQRSKSRDVKIGLKKTNNEKSELVASENESNSYDEMENSFADLADEGGVIMWKDDINSKRVQHTSTSESLVNNISAETMEDKMVNVEVEGVVDQVNNDEHTEGETSSRLEHSESDGSMYGYGTDNEEVTVLPPRGYTNNSQENKNNGEKTLFMTSSVAYGADDWNDYMQETMENPQDLFVLDEIQDHSQNETENEANTSKSTSVCENADMAQKQENVKEFHMNNQNDSAHELPTYSRKLEEEEERGQLVNGMIVISKQAENGKKLKVEAAPLMDVLSLPMKPENTDSNETLENLSNNLKLGHVPLTLTKEAEDHAVDMANDHNPYLLQSLPNINVEKRQNGTPISLDSPEDVQMASKAENYELNEFYDEVVFEMEEILLDSGKSPAARFTRSRKHHTSHTPQPTRDGSSTASTSNTQNPSQNPNKSHKIDNIEVIGAKQKKGDVSLGERLVGVKEYTVYILRITSGTHQWEVERRYRDFFTLYRRLKSSFATKGWDLPTPWSLVDKESRKYFGNASPDVVSERSVLIQECLQSILHSKFSSGLPNSMIWFLSPPKNGQSSLPFNARNGNPQVQVSLGQSISLIVEIRAHKSMRQILEAQHYTCAGCHKYFDEGKTRLWEFVQTLGFGKPRLCEYSGQVFCSNCHVNETAILPARVLHWWDFTEYPVSQLAKSYLDSIHDKPMLCVSAVNPFLFSKVPPLQHVINVRKRIGRMLPYVRCPFRKSIYKGVGSRRYLLESTDFFALKDLVDLSKGVFAALPVMVETISKKIVNHITDECLICYDVGVPCGARQACDDPSALIFPFQEGEVERCKSCELVYHKACLKKTYTCPCGVDLGSRSMRSPSFSPNEMRVAPNNMERETESKYSIGFLSGLLSKANSAKFWGTKENDTVIPMGSLPSSSSL